MDKSSKIWMVVAIVLFVVILVLTWMLFAIPTPRAVPVQPARATTTVAQHPAPKTTPANQPLSKSVSVTAPVAHSTVGSSFAIKGSAPGGWYFEASFPIQVRDKDGNVIGRTHASAQGEWMTTKQVSFTATMNIEGAYKGPGTLVLMRDNPSGLPENDDAVEIPIVIQ